MIKGKERLTSHIQRLTYPWLSHQEMVPALKTQICPISEEELDLAHCHLSVSFPFHDYIETLTGDIVR